MCICNRGKNLCVEDITTLCTNVGVVTVVRTVGSAVCFLILNDIVTCSLYNVDRRLSTESTLKNVTSVGCTCSSYATVRTFGKSDIRVALCCISRECLLGELRRVAAICSSCALFVCIILTCSSCTYSNLDVMSESLDLNVAFGVLTANATLDRKSVV